MLPAEQLRGIHARMKGVAQRLRLPLRRHNWKGLAGNWLGVGIGSSIDFQDHRPYLPGDDPRYIDWQAYARTGNYTMKLYREEVSPRVDVVVDASESMRVDEAKAQRAVELVYFAIESALVSNSSVRCFAGSGADWSELPLASVLGYRLELPEERSADPMDLRKLPLRHGSLRVVISDLLFPGRPEELLQGLRANRGRGVIFAPYSLGESSPGWEGNVEMTDCETGEIRRQRVTPDLLNRYRAAYKRHFELWADTARRYDINFARSHAETEFADDLHRDALPSAAVEMWN